MTLTWRLDLNRVEMNQQNICLRGCGAWCPNYLGLLSPVSNEAGTVRDGDSINLNSWGTKHYNYKVVYSSKVIVCTQADITSALHSH